MKVKKPILKTWWFITIMVIFIISILIIGCSESSNNGEGGIAIEVVEGEVVEETEVVIEEEVVEEEVVEETEVVVEEEEAVITPTIDSTPTVSKPISTTVYITNTGAKYHLSGCRYLSQSKISIDLSEAKSQGYEPCSVCKP